MAGRRRPRCRHVGAPPRAASGSLGLCPIAD